MESVVGMRCGKKNGLASWLGCEKLARFKIGVGVVGDIKIGDHDGVDVGGVT